VTPSADTFTRPVAAGVNTDTCTEETPVVGTPATPATGIGTSYWPSPDQSPRPDRTGYPAPCPGWARTSRPSPWSPLAARCAAMSCTPATNPNTRDNTTPARSTRLGTYTSQIEPPGATPVPALTDLNTASRGEPSSNQIRPRCRLQRDLRAPIGHPGRARRDDRPEHRPVEGSKQRTPGAPEGVPFQLR
jgi:hypothetical protein